MTKVVGALGHWPSALKYRLQLLLRGCMKSGPGQPTLSQRDRWILDQFAFFKPHIYVCPKRTKGLVSMINNLSAKFTLFTIPLISNCFKITTILI